MALTMGLIRAKRVRQRRNQLQKESNPSMPCISNNQFNNHIYKMILDQQIDAVFLSLSTIIETEKVKLKALMGGQSLIEQISAVEPFHHPPSEQAQMNDAVQNDTPTTDHIADSIAAKSSKGMTPKEIARVMGLSLSEVVLALRMNNGSRDVKAIGGQLEAIA
jgi:hypothetical protein